MVDGGGNQGRLLFPSTLYDFMGVRHSILDLCQLAPTPSLSYLDRIREANRYDPSDYRPFRVAGLEVGLVRHGFAESLRRWPQVFAVSEDCLRLAPALNAEDSDPGARSSAVDTVVRQLHAQGKIENWYDEAFPVSRSWQDAPLLLMERAALPFFGVTGYGVHMNGYVREGGQIKLWVARRAKDKATFPGKLDHLVAGGQPFGISPRENLAKECFEEAGIPRSRALLARPAGRVHYAVDLGQGLRPDTIFVFDLELSPDFLPYNNDGEVESFHLWSMDEVSRCLRETTEFKYNCALVIIDFLVRTGFIPKDHPEYADIVTMLAARGPGRLESAPC
jgi:8-oxo-dGTP pyrophosphatase MutT (NUDIX family)